MNRIWVSAKECSQQDLLQLTELIRKDRDMQIILSCDQPTAGESRRLTEERAAELLVRLGIRPNLKGYHYLKTAVRLCTKDREELDGITKRLYPDIARKHGTTAGKVEHAVRHAIGTAWIKGDAEMQRAVFGYCFEADRRPTNAEFIVQLLEYLEKLNRPMFS